MRFPVVSHITHAYTHTQTTSKDVDRIANSETLVDVLQLVKAAYEDKGVVTRRFAVAALRRLATLAEKSHRNADIVRANPCVEPVLALLEEQADDLSARDLVDVLHSACKLEVIACHPPCAFTEPTPDALRHLLR